MATAIYYKSESGDSYLNLYESPFSIKQIVNREKSFFGEEWEHLREILVESSDYEPGDVSRAITSSINSSVTQ